LLRVCPRQNTFSVSETYCHESVQWGLRKCQRREGAVPVNTFELPLPRGIIRHNLKPGSEWHVKHVTLLTLCWVLHDISFLAAAPHRRKTPSCEIILWINSKRTSHSKYRNGFVFMRGATETVTLVNKGNACLDILAEDTEPWNKGWFHSSPFSNLYLNPAKWYAERGICN